jgi:hypothetical protein
MINIRDLSLRCGRCLNFMTLTEYAPREGWNTYTFQCDGGSCDPVASRAVVEVPAELDEFAQKHPACGGGCSTR